MTDKSELEEIRAVKRYKIQQDKGRYCLKGCDDGDLIDYSRYKFDLAAARERIAVLEAALHRAEECAGLCDGCKRTVKSALAADKDKP